LHLVLVDSRVLPSLKARHWRLLSVFSAASLIALVGSAVLRCVYISD
jgi:hypothetical protein